MPLKHLGVTLALAVSLIGGPATIAVAQPLAPVYASGVSVAQAPANVVKVTTANLNLRKEANTKSASLLVVPQNTSLAVLKTSGKWHQVTHKSKTGWVSGDYLKTVPAAKPKVYNYTNAYTAVKAKAASSSATVLSIHRQSKVEVLGASGSWTKISVSGKTGFVPGKVLAKTNPAAVSRWVKGSQKVFASTSTSSKPIITLSNNTKVSWLRASGSWQQVRTTAGIGWVQTKNLSTSQIKPPAKPKVYNYTNAYTAVKAKAASSSATVLSIHRQSKVEVLGTSGSWTKVLVSGKTGFVPSKVLAKTNPAPVYRWSKGSQKVFASTSTSSKSIITLSNNRRVSWLRTSGSWQQVRTTAGIGWVQTKNLSTNQIKPAAKPKVYNYSNAYAAVKSKAASSSSTVRSIHRQTKVEVLGTSGSWTKIVVSGKTGFVPSKVLAKTNPAPVYRWSKGSQKVFASTSTSSKSIITLSNNRRVSWLRTSGSWQQVRTTAGIGWVQTKNLSTSEIKPPAPKPPVQTFKTPKWSTSAVNVRTGAGTSYSSLGVIPAGEKVMVAGSTNGWANVKSSKGVGWISETYLSAVEDKPEIDEKPEVPEYRWTKTNLNLRSSNSTNATALGVVPAGEKVTYLESKGGWAKVVSSEGTGWMSESYLSAVEFKPESGNKPETTQYRWARGNTNLRSGKSTSHKILGVVPAGEKVTYLESDDGWAKVVSSQGTGWMSEALLSKTSVAQLQPDTVAVMDVVRKYYGSAISSIGGVRAGSVGHSSGKAADIMIKNYKTAASIGQGDDMAQFLIKNREALGISYLIWQDKIWLGPSKGWEEYSQSGKYGNQFAGNWNDTTRHMDHIHAETYGESGTGAPLVR